MVSKNFLFADRGSNKSLFIVALAAMTFLFSCTPPKINATDDDYKIGDLLAKMSSLSKADGTEKNVIGIYDETVQKIHIFDLKNHQHINTLDSNPSAVSAKEHFVLYDDQGNYVVDITTKGFAIINKNNQSNKNALKLMGKPISAAFRSDLGYLVLYDDAGSIGIFKLDSQGNISKQYLLGNRVDSAFGAPTIAAGDLLDNGNLVASLSDGRLAVIDLEQTLNQRKWVYSVKSTNLTKAQWIARVPNNANQVLFRISAETTGSIEHKIYLYDLATESVLNQLSISGYVEKSSRSSQPHFLISSADRKEISLIYPEAGQLQLITQFRHNLSIAKNIVNSQLDLKTNVFSFIEVQTRAGYYDENLTYNSITENRAYKKFRLPDMLLLNTFKIPNGTTMEMSEDFILALFPHRLGYAISYATDESSQHEFKFFNRGNLKKP